MQVRTVVSTTFVCFPDGRIPDFRTYCSRVHLCLTENRRCTSNSNLNFDRFDQIWTRVKCYECTLIPLFVWYFRHTFVPSPVGLHVKKLFYLPFDPYQNSPVPLSQRCRLVKMRLLPGYLMFSVKYQIDFIRQKFKRRESFCIESERIICTTWV